MLSQLEETYACLIELRNWRDQFPDIRIVPCYTTRYGKLGAQ